jgi:mannose/fructose/N-acetylgalactosamine-specific phosphotransferase system component IID
MKQLLKWIGISIFLGWTIAILVNYSIYQHATTQLTLIDPIVDGILFMLVMFAVYLFIWRTYKSNPSTASIQIAVLGVLSMSLAFMF